MPECSTAWSAGYVYGSSLQRRSFQCGNAVSSTLTSRPKAECDKNCPGSTDKCGGTYRINIYTYSKPVPATWSYQGCYSDTSSARSLAVGVSGNSVSMTACLAQCQSRGYTLGGVEYGQECWCGNALNAKASPIADAKCNMACREGGSQCG